jgi:hypothetical protein
MTQVSDMIDEAVVEGFLHEGGGVNLAATLAALPGMFTAFRTSVAQLAAWTEDKPCRQAAGAITVIAQAAGACAEAAQAASDRYRKANAFWLDGEPDGQASHGVTNLASMIEGGFIPRDDDHPDGQVLDIILEQLPELADVTGENLGIMISWMRDNHMSGETEVLLGEVGHHVGVLSAAAEDASSAYQRDNAFWLTSRRLL